MAVKTREKSKRLYELSVKLTQQAKEVLSRSEVEDMENALGAYIKLTQEPIEEPTEENPNPENVVEVETAILQQMALLASGQLARMISQRYRR